jgi:hypothetical protein
VRLPLPTALRPHLITDFWSFLTLSAHLLTLSLTSALSSVPPAVQNRVFTQSPQLHHLPHPGLRFDFGDEDWGWKERAADGLGKGMVWAWVTGLPVRLILSSLLPVTIASADDPHAVTPPDPASGLHCDGDGLWRHPGHLDQAASHGGG